MNVGAGPPSELWNNTRLVVVDVETTGLGPGARIIAFAAFVVEGAATKHSWSTLVNPGGAIGATHIHGLDSSTLAGAPSFAAIAEQIRGLLFGSDKTTYLVGHNVPFDAGRLLYEFANLGDPLTDLLTLDTKHLAPAAGHGSTRSSLEDLAASFGLSNPAAHEANADALLTREVALRSIEILTESGLTSLSQYARPAQTSRYSDYDDESALSDEHRALHAASLLDRRSREAALDGCLALNCPRLHRRIVDGVVDPISAEQTASWVLAQMSQPGLTRFRAGLLASGYAAVLRTWREMLTRPGRGAFRGRAQALLNSYEAWTACDDDDDLCDHCTRARAAAADGDPDPQQYRRDECRFIMAPRSAVLTPLYANTGELPAAAARDYLFGKAVKPCTKRSWFFEFADRSPAAALSGAVAAGRALRTEGQSDQARVAMTYLWDTATRSPALTELCAALAEDARPSTREGWEAAAEICRAGLTGAASGSWVRVEAKLARLNRRINAQERPAWKQPYNTRPGRGSVFTRP